MIKSVIRFFRRIFLFLKKYKSSFAGIIILVLMISDYFTMNYMFSPDESDIDPQAQMLYSFVLALCLEGLPFILGQTLNIKRDTTTYKANEKENANIGFWTSLIGTIIAGLLVVSIRGLSIFKKGGIDGYLHKNYDLFVTDIALCVFPVLTSLMAFGLSWVFLRKERIEEQEKKVDICYSEYLNKEQIFSEKLHTLQEQRTALWSSITNYLPIPNTLETYRREVVARIRSLMIQNSIICFPAEINVFNSLVEDALLKYLIELSARSTVPTDIASIKIKSLIEEYDLQCTDDIDKWSSQATIEALDRELRALCSNEIVIEQAYVAVGKEPIERKSLI